VRGANVARVPWRGRKLASRVLGSIGGADGRLATTFLTINFSVNGRLRSLLHAVQSLPLLLRFMTCIYDVTFTHPLLSRAITP